MGLVLIGLICGAVGFTGLFWLAWSAIDENADREVEREIVVIGWDGRSQPMRRYADEMHLPDHMRSLVTD